MKIRFSRSLVGLALVSSLGLPAFAQVQDGPAVNYSQVAKELKQLKERQKTGSTALITKVIQDFRNASASNGTAIAFYQSALMATKNQAFNDVQDISRIEVVQIAARIHLNYLVLTVQHALGATTKQLEPGLVAHVASVMQAQVGDAAIWTRREKARQLTEQGNTGATRKGMKPADKEPMFCELDLVNKSVKDSPFVKWYGIDSLLSGDKTNGTGGADAADTATAGGNAQGGSAGQDWEMTPANIDGIYQSILLPYYRQIKDLRAVGYWDQKLQQDAQKVNATNSAFEIDKFNRITRPKLLWSRAKDEIAIGMKNKGIADMMDVVRACADHPDLAGWISELEGMMPGAPKPADSPAAKPAAAQQ